MPNNSPLTPLNNPRKHTQPRRRRVVRSQHPIRTLIPAPKRRINRLLHIRPVEVDRRALRQIRLAPREPKHIPQLRARGRHLVDVPTRVEPEDLVEDGVEDVAVVRRAAVLVRAGELDGERARGWEGQVFL
jgi:hypothetical protein